MMHADPNPSHWSKKLDVVYYAPLVPQGLLEQVMTQFASTDSEQAFDIVLSILDYVVLGELAKHMDTPSVIHFLQRAETEYNDVSLLEIISQYDAQLTTAVQQVLERQLLALYSGLNSMV